MPHFTLVRISENDRVLPGRGTVQFWSAAFGEYAVALRAPERRMVSVFRHSWIYVLGVVVTTIVLLLYIDLS
jgi:hypothetical protein